jgi:hypothetical protein
MRISKKLGDHDVRKISSDANVMRAVVEPVATEKFKYTV